jgi:aminoglycoside 6'-N-acetyltransferase I
VSDVIIRQAQASDRDVLAEMRAQLWPEATVEQHRRELERLLAPAPAGPRGWMLPSAILVATDGEGVPLAFLEVDLRSHVDGCDPTRPTGYVEGWYVRDGLRRQGVGRALMRAAEEWAREQGCVEMGSDALIDNIGSERAHLALGFEVVDRCVNFRKTLTGAARP